MNELEKLLTDKVGLSPDQAQRAVAEIIGFLKERLPAPIAGHLDALTAGGAGGAPAGGAGGLMGEAEKALGGMMGKL